MCNIKKNKGTSKWVIWLKYGKNGKRISVNVKINLVCHAPTALCACQKRNQKFLCHTKNVGAATLINEPEEKHEQRTFSCKTSNAQRGNIVSKQNDALKLALEALELAQDNLREHGDNCFLHDEGEYNRCFCGKDSLSDHLQSVVEKLDEALAQPEQEPTPPPQRKPLTDEQINAFFQGMEPNNGFWKSFAKAIEAAHGILEQGDNND